nr:lysoplasmalogenase-like [Cherax quadricarinatus]
MALFLPMEEPSVAGAVLKCLPIVCLLGFLAQWSGDPGARQSARWHCAALLLGDVCLVWPKELLAPGVVFFGLAQVSYVMSLGFQRVNWRLGLALHLGSLLAMALLLPLIPSLALKFLLTGYSILLTTMGWRALDRARLVHEVCGAQRACTLGGAVAFWVSDASIVILQLGQLIPHKYAQAVILSTYYIAQLLLTLGAAQKFWAGTTASHTSVTSTASSPSSSSSKARIASVRHGSSSVKNNIPSVRSNTSSVKSRIPSSRKSR